MACKILAQNINSIAIATFIICTECCYRNSFLAIPLLPGVAFPEPAPYHSGFYPLQPLTPVSTLDIPILTLGR